MDYKTEDAAVRCFEEDAVESYIEESVPEICIKKEATEWYDPEDAVELYDLKKMMPQWYDPEDTAELYDSEYTDDRYSPYSPDEDVNLSNLDEATRSLRLFEFATYEDVSPTPQLTLNHLSEEFDPCSKYPALSDRMEQSKAIHLPPPSHVVPDSLNHEDNLPEVDQLSCSSSEPEFVSADLIDCGWDLVECFSTEYSDISSVNSETDCPDLQIDETKPDSDSTTDRNELYNDVKRILAKLRRDEEDEERKREEMGSPSNKRPRWNLEGEHSESLTAAYTGWSPSYSPTTPQ